MSQPRLLLGLLLGPLLGPLLGLVLCLPPTLAAAQEQPTLLPTRDVDITYRSNSRSAPPGQPAPATQAAPIQQRSRFDAAAGLMRLDMPTPGLHMIVDYRTHTAALVSDADHAVLDMPLPATGLPGTGAAPAGSFVRTGADQVAGLPCTEWQTRDNRGQPATTCFTPDGVMLRARRGNDVLAVATHVQYGPLDPALFAVPANYAHVHAPPPARHAPP